MKCWFKHFIWLLVLVIYFPAIIQAQSNFSTEEELKKHALELFEEGDYQKALPLYSQLLSLYPKDPNHNYRYGTCLLFADTDKEKPLKYLQFASSKEGVEPEVFFYFGKALHLNYRFDDAIDAYTKFNEKADKKSKAALQADRQIQMCNNGKLLIRNITDLVVIEKKEITKTDFFRSYSLGDFGGKIIVKPDEFKTPVDIKKKESSILFLPDNAEEIYFASYGDDDKNGKEIYKVSKLTNGEWSKPTSIGSAINTPYDEDFPFMHPNGNTLYFCSKGHNSMGGYDIFSSTLNTNNNTWGPPVNLDFAINSPDDDILFITDAEEEFAYFSSGRASIEGNTSVYKIKLDRKLLEFALIKGNFIPADKERPFKAKITVRNLGSNEVVATSEPDSLTGDYMLSLKKGGKYKFIIESEGSPLQSGVVEIEKLQDKNVLKQEMELVNSGTGMKLIIRNLFDDGLADAEPVPLDFIKKQATLDVNYDAEEEAKKKLLADANKQNENPADTNEKDQEVTADTKTENTSNSNISDKEIISIAYEDAETLKKEGVELKNEADFIYVFAENKGKAAQEKLTASENKIAASANIEDNNQREAELEKAKQLKKQSDQLAREAVVSFNLAQKLESDANKKENEAQQSLQYAKELENAVNSNSSKETLAKLNAQKEKLENSAYITGSEEAVNTIKKQSLAKQAEAEKALRKSNELKEELTELTVEINNLKSEAQKTKDNSVKTELNTQVQDLQVDFDETEKKYLTQVEKADQLKKEAGNLETDADLATDLIQEINTNEEIQRPVTFTAEQKNELKSKISVLETQSKDSQKKELASFDSNVKTNENKSTVLNSNIEEENNETGEIEIVDENGEVYDYGSLYLDKLDKVELLEDEYKKEKTREEIYRNWSSSIGKEAALRKEKLSTLNKKDRKAEEQKITALENLAIDKKLESEKSLAKAGELEKAALALNDNEKNAGNENENNADHNSTEENIGEINYNDYSADTVETAEASKTIETAENNETTNTSENTQTNEDTETAENIKTTETTDNTEKVDTEKVVKENKNSNTVSKNKELEDLLNTPAVTEASEKQYVSQEANKERLNAESIYKEAEALSIKANQKRATSSGIADLEERKLLLDEATELDKQAQDKKIESSLTYAKANMAEFLIQESELAKLARANKDKRSDELSIAGMLREEAQYYFNEAKNIRENGNNTENPVSRLNALNKANEYEVTAIDKQQKAREIYNKFAPAVATTTTPPTKVVEDGNNNIVIANKDQSDPEINKPIKLTEEQEQEISRLNVLAEEESEKAVQLRKEAGELNNEANELQEQAENTKKKKEKAELVEMARVKNEDAINKQNKAAIAEQQSEKFKSEAESIADSKPVNDDLASNNNLTIEEKIAIETNRIKETNSSKNSGENTESNNNTETNNSIEENNEEQDQNEVEDKNEEQENLLTNERQIEIDNLTRKIEEEKETAEKMQEEAQQLAEESENLTKQAGDTKKKKEKAALLEESTIKNEASITRQKEAEAVYENVEKLEEELSEMMVLQANTDKAKTNTETPKIANENNTTAENTETNSPLNETEKIKNSEEYKNYSQLKADAKRKEELSREEFVIADNFRRDGESQLSLANGLKENADQIENEEEKQEALRSAQEYIDLGNTNLLKADSVEKIAKNYEAEASSGQIEADQYLQSLDRDIYNDIIDVSNKELVYSNNNNSTVNNEEKDNITNNSTVTENTTNDNTNNTTENAENTATNNNDNLNETIVQDPVKNNLSPTPGKYEIPAVLTEEIFETTPTVVYTAANPIPLNSKLPEGLVFKVQVGAFRNPIPQDLFKGFAPILGESTPQGFTRYTAGIFKSLETANLAKEVIRGYGYRDAFVVAFYNGKRISFREAQAIIRSGKTTLANNNVNNNVPANNNVNTNENTTTGENPVTSPVIGTNMAAFEELSDVKGLLFTVQVGVYSKAVTSAQLFNIQPLYVEKTTNGFLRYTSGIYDSEARANEARNIIARIGIKDAFVTAYNNGKRISPAEARALEGANGKSIFVKSVNLNKLPETGTGNTIASFNKDETSGDPVNNTANNNTTVTNNNNTSSAVKPVFKVQIGAFREEVPIEIASIFIKLSSRGIAHYVNEEGLTVYTLGAFPDVESANNLKNELKTSYGLSDAFVVSYIEDKKIPLDEAIKLVNE